MQAEHAPPGFWRWPADQSVLIDGVELDSAVPTRFFQTLDPYPLDWGRLSWRVQLNKLVSGHASSPVFRTFYAGVEWNLRHPDAHWFLSAWFRWDGPGPPQREDDLRGAVQIADDTALFRIAWFDGTPLFLRCRVDARDRRAIAEARGLEVEREAKRDAAIIVLDDVIETP